MKEKVKVLWFSRTPGLAENQLKNRNVGGGWIKSLQTLLNNHSKIELAISFYTFELHEKEFYHDGVKYFPIILNRGESILHKALYNWRHRKVSKQELDRINEIVATYNPDLIHVFGTESAFGLISEYTSKPTIIHLQGLIDPCFRNFLPPSYSFWHVIKRSNLMEFFYGIGLIHEYMAFIILRKQEKRIFEATKYYMGRTRWDKSYVDAKANNGVYFHLDEVIRPEFFNESTSLCLSGKFKIITTINPAVYKGLEHILITAHLLKTKSIINFEWIVAGVESTHSLISFFESKEKLSFSENNVRFVGKKNEVDLVNELRSTNLFVHPSHIDNSPNSVCEAMVMGLPVIANNVGGLSSLIKHKIDGYLYENDPIVLFSYIVEIYNNYDEAKEIARKGQITARHRHNPELIISGLMRIYKTVIKAVDGISCDL